jgi:hypothetical protein
MFLYQTQGQILKQYVEHHARGDGGVACIKGQLIVIQLKAFRIISVF